MAGLSSCFFASSAFFLAASSRFFCRRSIHQGTVSIGPRTDRNGLMKGVNHAGRNSAGLTEYTWSHKWWLNQFCYLQCTRKPAKEGHARTMGTQRCPMETHRTDLKTAAAGRRSWSTLAGDASRAQRNSVGVGHRSAVARTARQVSAVPNLPSPFPALGAGRHAGAHLARAGRGAPSTGETRPGGGFHRCLLHGGKKGGLAVGPTNRGKGTKIIALADAHSLALAVSIESASPHETQLVEGVLGHSFLDTLPARLIGDKAYDSDRLDRDLAERYGIEMIAPHRGERRTPTQDGRPLRRLSPTLASGTTFCVAASFSSARDPLGVPRRELLRHGPPRLHANPVQVFMRPVVGMHTSVSSIWTQQAFSAAASYVQSDRDKSGEPIKTVILLEPGVEERVRSRALGLRSGCVTKLGGCDSARDMLPYIPELEALLGSSGK